MYAKMKFIFHNYSRKIFYWEERMNCLHDCCESVFKNGDSPTVQSYTDAWIRVIRQELQKQYVLASERTKK